MTYTQAALEVIEICKWLHARGLLAATDGNVSVRLSDDEILMTPSGMSKARLKPEDLAVVTLENSVRSGNPTSERLMHLEVLKRCEKAKVVVHAHPPTAIAWSVAHPEMKELPSECLSELTMGRVPIVPYACPGTKGMADVLVPFLPQNRAMILARHGALSWGEDFEEAYNGMERLEHVARILKSAKELGGLTVR